MKPDDARRALLSRKTALERIRSAVNLEGEATSEEIREIDAALRRIQEGSWGRCESCDRAIGRQRLQALPETRRCAVCIQAAEHPLHTT
jgi:RNA polymerase-binding transcription factor DksA